MCRPSGSSFYQKCRPRPGPVPIITLHPAQLRIISLVSHRTRGRAMKDRSSRLGPREQQITELLLQGCDNSEIAGQLQMARRTVKAHFNRLFMRFGITGGIKRVKLATMLYRRQICSEQSVLESEHPVQPSSGLSNSSHKGSRTVKSRNKL